MTNDLTPLEPDEVDALDETVPPEDDSAQEAPSELESLRAEVESLKHIPAAIEDLKRSTGRIQSLLTKWESATGAEREQISKQVDDRLATVDDQIAQILSGLDETAIDPETKQRILSVREQSRRTAELRAAVDEEVRKRVPAQTSQPSQASPLEEELVNIITAAGGDPDSATFDWKGEMSRLAQADPTGNTLRKHVLDKLFESRSEDDSATRRTTAKRQAGQGAPKPNSVAANEAGRIQHALDSGDLAAAIKERAALMR